jgi:hypothetical protein
MAITRSLSGVGILVTRERRTEVAYLIHISETEYKRSASGALTVEPEEFVALIEAYTQGRVTLELQGGGSAVIIPDTDCLQPKEMGYRFKVSGPVPGFDRSDHGE